MKLYRVHYQYYRNFLKGHESITQIDDLERAIETRSKIEKNDLDIYLLVCIGKI